MTSKCDWVGLDVFLKTSSIPDCFAGPSPFELKSIANRGTQVWPGETPEFDLCDIFQCRFLAKTDSTLDSGTVRKLLDFLDSKKLDWVHIEKLFNFDGKPGFSNPSKA